MSLSGKMDLQNGSFDIFNFEETQSFITYSSCGVTLSYLSPGGKLVQLKKDLPENPIEIRIGSALISSGIQDDLGGGYVESTLAESANVIGKALAYANFSDASSLAKYETKMFVDQNGVNRTAVLLPVQLNT